MEQWVVLATSREKGGEWAVNHGIASYFSVLLFHNCSFHFYETKSVYWKLPEFSGLIKILDEKRICPVKKGSSKGGTKPPLSPPSFTMEREERNQLPMLDVQVTIKIPKDS